MANKDKAPVPIELSAEQIAGINNVDLAESLLNSIAGSLFIYENETAESRNKRINAAVATIKSLAPKDAVEAHLIAQMICSHNIAMECTRRANINGQTFDGRDMALKYAAKYMSLFQDQLRTLNKHRGKGDQKVTIEHVNVAAGGQAIVGNINAGGPKSSRSHSARASQKALAHTPAGTLDLPMSKLKEKQPVATKKK